MFCILGLELEKRPLFAFAIRKLPCSRPVCGRIRARSLSPKFERSCSRAENRTSRAASGSRSATRFKCLAVVERLPPGVRGQLGAKFVELVASSVQLAAEPCRQLGCARRVHNSEFGGDLVLQRGQLAVPGVGLLHQCLAVHRDAGKFHAGNWTYCFTKTG